MKVVENPKTRTISAKVTEEMYQKYRRIAKTYGTSVSTIAGEALVAYTCDAEEWAL